MAWSTRNSCYNQGGLNRRSWDRGGAYWHPVIHRDYHPFWSILKPTLWQFSIGKYWTPMRTCKHDFTACLLIEWKTFASEVFQCSVAVSNFIQLSNVPTGMDQNFWIDLTNWGSVRTCSLAKRAMVVAPHKKEMEPIPCCNRTWKLAEWCRSETCSPFLLIWHFRIF